MEWHGSGGIAGKGGGVVYNVLLHLFIDKKAKHGGKCMDKFLIVQQVEQLNIFFISTAKPVRCSSLSQKK
jgi:hypothetical protein